MAKSISRRLADSASPTGAIDGTLSTAAQTNITSVGTLSSLAVTGEITANGGIALGDNDKATFGASDDLQIYHDGSNSIISESGTGGLRIETAGVSTSGFYKQNSTPDEAIAIFEPDGPVTLYYNNAPKLATTSTGIDITGTVTATKLVSANGVLELDDNGTHNGVINSPASLFINIDSDSNNTGEDFVIGKDRTSTSGGSELFRVQEDGNVGIGTSSPSLPLHVKSDTSGLPATSGTTQTNGVFRLSSTATSGIIDFGMNGTNPWIQSTGSDGLGATYNLLLNPNGGNVGIGVSSLNNPLEVAVTPNTTSKTSGSAFDGAAIRLNGNLATTNSESAIIAGLDNGIQAGIGFMRESISNWGSAIKFYTRQAAVVDLDGVAERMRITSSGNVGIGSPTTYGLLNSTRSITGGTSNTTEHLSLVNTATGAIGNQATLGFHVAASSWGVAFTGATVSAESESASSGATSLVFGTNVSGASATTTERMRIASDGIIVHNGVSTYSNSAYMINNVAYIFDVPVGDEGGSGNVIEVHAMYDHFYNFGYGASLITLVGKRGVSVNRSDIKVITTANGGSWTISAPNSSTLRLTKNAGTYPGGGFGHIMVRFRKP